MHVGVPLVAVAAGMWMWLHTGVCRKFDTVQSQNQTVQNFKSIDTHQACMRAADKNAIANVYCGTHMDVHARLPPPV